ncbi:Pyridoxal phosphate homeostasis protein [bioreactor metagenome]|uniref:Pyridoxal phosphate homeostasis protein n=1 Tax=bioreactor metagenome TaxID=1076179 RepID=A0A645HD24_9ZZZZ
MDKCAKKLGIVQDVLLEVNIGMEESKSGFDYDAVKPALDEADSLQGARVCGLMAIPPISSESGENTPYFEKMRDLFVDIRPHLLHNSSKIYLSMGMSDDFEDAIAAGSTLIRVGTAIFGHRNYNI